MKSFGEYKKVQAIEEKLVPQIMELLKHLDDASAEAENMPKTLDVLENARLEIIKLEGK